MLDAAELYEYDYSDYATTGGYSLRFDGENDLTAALYRLTSGEQRHAYVLTGHGEKSLTETLSITLEKQGFALNTLSLLSGTVPEDCDLLELECSAESNRRCRPKVNEVGRMKRVRSGRQAAGAYRRVLPDPESGRTYRRNSVYLGWMVS